MPIYFQPILDKTIYNTIVNGLSEFFNTTVTKLAPSTIQLSNLSQGIIILALATALFYFAVSGYYVGYFQKLSLPFYSMEFPSAFYIYAGHWIGITIFIIFVPLLYTVVFPQPVPNFSHMDGLSIIKSAFLILAFLLFLYLAWDNTNTISYTMGLTSIAVIIFFDLQYIAQLFGEFMEKAGQKDQIMDISFGSIIILFLFPCLIYAVFRVLGEAVAVRLIRGDKNSLKVELEPIDENPDISNKSFMLVMHNGGMYYVVEEGLELNPPDAKAYIIPDSQIKKATITTVGKSEIREEND